MVITENEPTLVVEGRAAVGISRGLVTRSAPPSIGDRQALPLAGTGTSRSRSVFVDDARYAALENPDTASQVNGVNIQLNGDPTQASRVAMVTSGVVLADGCGSGSIGGVSSAPVQ